MIAAVSFETAMFSLPIRPPNIASRIHPSNGCRYEVGWATTESERPALLNKGIKSPRQVGAKHLPRL
jgi:hypothetical protein